MVNNKVSYRKQIARRHLWLKNFVTLGPRPLGTRAWLTPRNMPLPTCVTLPNLVIMCQTVWA